MILENKQVLVFAATGAIAGAAARKFANEGAHVWVSGRDEARLEKLVAEIQEAGGQATCRKVDATSEAEIDAHIKEVVAESGAIHGVFNGIGGRPADLGYPAPVQQLNLEQFMLPLHTILGSTYLTARAAGLAMSESGGGSIITLSATLSGMSAPFMAGLTAACGAIEAMTRSLAGEFGRAGVRVNCVRASAMPETSTIQETMAGQIEIMGTAPDIALPPLGRPITVDETVSTAAFLMSDLASGMTGQVVTVCAGAFVGQG